MIGLLAGSGFDYDLGAETGQFLGRCGIERHTGLYGVGLFGDKNLHGQTGGEVGKSGSRKRSQP
jgi:hypothetical protein